MDAKTVFIPKVSVPFRSVMFSGQTSTAREQSLQRLFFFSDSLPLDLTWDFVGNLSLLHFKYNAWVKNLS